MTRSLKGLLRWYPRAWRERYGEEFLALLEDECDGATPRLLFRARVAYSGVRERCRASGIIGDCALPETRQRGGSLLVLVAWAGMVVGGVGLAKSAEHFSSAMPASSRAGAQVAYDVAVGAGVAGSLLVVVGALVVSRALARLLSSGGWRRIRPSLLRALAASAVTGAAVVSLSAWAHRLSGLQRNGGDAAYTHAFLAVAILVVLTIGLWTGAVITVVSAMDLSSTVLRVESALAGGVGVAVAVLTASAGSWWLDVGRHAPWYLRGTSPGVAVSPWSAPMEVNMAIMMASLAVAGWGISRIAGASAASRLRASRD